MRFPATDTLPPNAAAFVWALIERGYDAVLVGGAVRDELRGVAATDLDFVTDATTDDIRSAANACGQVRSVYSVGERYGTVGLVFDDGTGAEVSRYRESARDAATTADRFALDAAQRDFTINAVGRDLATGSLLDPLGGAADVVRGVLRAPLVPAARFADDPLRVLRLARFVSQLGFAVEPATLLAAREAAGGLTRVSVERIRDELTKLLVAPHPDAGLRIARDIGALGVVLPEVAAMDGVTQPSFHDLDVFEHTLQSVALSPADAVMRWAALLHDVGKPVVRTVEPDGRIRFFRHATVGARLAESICARLRFSNADTGAIVHLVREHMRLGDLHVENRKAVARAVRKLDLWERGSVEVSPIVSAEDVLELTMADFSATAHRDEAPRVREVLGEAIAQARGFGPAQRPRSPLSGQDIIDGLTIKQGYRVGIAKNAIESAIASGEIEADDRAEAFRVAREALDNLQGE